MMWSLPEFEVFSHIMGQIPNVSACVFVPRLLRQAVEVYLCFFAACSCLLFALLFARVCLSKNLESRRRELHDRGLSTSKGTMTR